MHPLYTKAIQQSKWVREIKNGVPSGLDTYKTKNVIIFNEVLKEGSPTSYVKITWPDGGQIRRLIESKPDTRQLHIYMAKWQYVQWQVG